jgi:uncharacterized protein YjdB
MKTTTIIISAIILSFSALAQANDTMFIHKGHTIFEFATAEVDSIIFYRIQESQTPPSVESITLNQTILSMDVGDTLTLQATVLPSNAINKGVTWASSNPQVATIVNGKIFALSGGEAIIFAGTLDGNRIAKCTLTVSYPPLPHIPVTGVALSGVMDTLHLGDFNLFGILVFPYNATNQNVNITSNDTTVIEIDDQRATAVGIGTATITAITEDGGYVDSRIITVIPVPGVGGN